MTVDIHIVSFPRDYPWLNYCLRSIRKFVTGYRQIHLTLPPDAPRPQNITDIVVHADSPNVRHGYNRHQVAKLRACQHTDADFIMFIDSDHFCVKPTPVEHYFDGDKPQLWRRTFDSLLHLPPEVTGITKAAFKWKAPVEHALGFSCPWFTLEFLPIVHHRGVLLECLAYMENLHGQSIEDYSNTLSNIGIGDFLVMGSYALAKHPEHYSIREARPDYEFRFHGHAPYHGLPAHIAKHFDEILAQ